MPDDDHQGDEDEAHPRQRKPLAVVVVLVVLLAVAVAFAVVQTLRAGDLDDDRQRAELAAEARRVAGAFGEAYLSYDFDDVQGSSERILALATEDFAAGFEATQVPGLEELFANIQTTTRATAEEVFVGDVTDDRARALVIVDVEASSTATGEQTLNDLSFVLDLVRLDDTWRVDQVAPAPEPRVSGGEASTTTAPPG